MTWEVATLLHMDGVPVHQTVCSAATARPDRTQRNHPGEYPPSPGHPMLESLQGMGEGGSPAVSKCTVGPYAAITTTEGRGLKWHWELTWVVVVVGFRGFDPLPQQSISFTASIVRCGHANGQCSATIGGNPLTPVQTPDSAFHVVPATSSDCCWRALCRFIGVL